VLIVTLMDADTQVMSMGAEKSGDGHGRDQHGARRWSRSVRLLHRSGREDSERHRQDAEAEQRTEQILRRLPEGEWTVVSNFRYRHGAHGHVAIGPAGVFLITSRKPAGCVRVKDGVPWLRQGQADRPGVSVVRKVLDPARDLHRELRARTGQPTWVHAVVALWSEFPQRVAETNQVAFVQGRDLAAWLHGRPRQLDAAAQQAVVGAVNGVVREGFRRSPRVPRRHAA
jgi:hypothetical protein